jgi:hypothetical protein
MLLNEFKENDIDGRVFFWPLSILSCFFECPENVIAYGLYGRAVNLPTYHDIGTQSRSPKCVVRSGGRILPAPQAINTRHSVGLGWPSC